MSINLKALHTEADLLFNTVDIAALRHSEILFIRDKCGNKSPVLKRPGRRETLFFLFYKDLKKGKFREKCWFYGFKEFCFFGLQL